MNEIILVILKVFPIITILLLGVWMSKTAFINADTVRGMTKITMNISLPCLLFLTFLKAELKLEHLILSAVIFVACLFEFALGFLIKKLQKSSNQFYPTLFTSFLTGPIGFPLFTAYFGTANLYKLAILDVGNSLFIFTVLTAFLSTVSCNTNSTEKVSTAATLKKLFKSPLTNSIFLGIIISLSGYRPVLESFPAVTAMLEAVSLLASAVFPMTLLIIGNELPFDFKNFRKTITVIIIRLTMMLSIAYLINTFVISTWLGMDETYQAALYTLFLLPPPFAIPLSINGECEQKKYVLDFISLHLLVSIVAFVILMYLI